MHTDLESYLKSLQANHLIVMTPSLNVRYCIHVIKRLIKYHFHEDSKFSPISIKPNSTPKAHISKFGWFTIHSSLTTL